MFKNLLVSIFLLLFSSNIFAADYDYLLQLKNGGLYREVAGPCMIEIAIIMEEGMMYVSWSNQIDHGCPFEGTFETRCHPTKNACRFRSLGTHYKFSVFNDQNLLLTADEYPGQQSLFRLVSW